MAGVLLVAAWLGWPEIAGTTGSAGAPQLSPAVYLIERFGTNGVLVHFDTDPHRTYELEFRDHAPADGAGAGWSNLFVAPLLPWPNHYIIFDARTNRARFYRLKVTP